MQQDYEMITNGSSGDEKQKLVLEINVTFHEKNFQTHDKYEEPIS